MQSCNVQSKRGLFIAACLTAALTAQSALADCPPGYRSKAGHCIPGPAQPHHPYVMKSNLHTPIAVSPVHPSEPHTYAHASAVTPAHTTAAHHAGPTTVYASHSTHHAGPAPAGSSYGYDLRAQHEAKSAHGIIFVGGKQALNPQPIPPGHAIKAVPHPGAPIENPAGH